MHCHIAAERVALSCLFMVFINRNQGRFRLSQSMRAHGARRPRRGGGKGEAACVSGFVSDLNRYAALSALSVQYCECVE
jgi:hypothetical protein